LSKYIVCWEEYDDYQESWESEWREFNNLEEARRFKKKLIEIGEDKNISLTKVIEDD